MAREVEFVDDISPTDRHRRWHLAERGRILQFVVQYETKIGDKWHPVVRYDTAHGFFHRDLMRGGRRSEKTIIHATDFNVALTIAEKDLRENWQKYKELFLLEIKQHESKE